MVPDKPIPKPEPIKRKVFYFIRNGGDGSAWPVFFESESDRNDAYKKEDEPLCEADGSITLIVKDGKPYIENREYDYQAKKYVKKIV